LRDCTWLNESELVAPTALAAAVPAATVAAGTFAPNSIIRTSDAIIGAALPPDVAGFDIDTFTQGSTTGRGISTNRFYGQAAGVNIN